MISKVSYLSKLDNDINDDEDYDDDHENDESKIK